MQLVFLLIISFLIANFLGNKRQIGFGWSFFFSIFLTPIGGLIATMVSRKFVEPNPEPSPIMRIVGWVLIAWFSISFIYSVIRLGNTPSHLMSLQLGSIGICIGLIGLGFYLIELSKGKNFNEKGGIQ